MAMRMSGIRETRGMLQGMKQRAEDLRPIWPAVGDVIATAMHQQFVTGGAYGGKPWKPLDPEYREWKVRHGYDGRTLIKTGAMMQSLTSRPMSIERYRPKTADFGSDDPKLPFHEFGTRRGLPRRQVMFRFEPMVTRSNRKIAAWIIDGVTG